jgi:hypothetical protein
MRRLVILLAVIFAVSAMSAPALGATACPTKSTKVHRTTAKKKMPKKVSKAKMKCAPVKSAKKATPAKAGAGPRVIQPVVKCPEQPAPIVNVPEQPAPVVNVAPPPPSTAITVDTNSIYIVRDNQLIILNKCDLCLKNKVSLDQVGSVPTPSGSSP